MLIQTHVKHCIHGRISKASNIITKKSACPILRMQIQSFCIWSFLPTNEHWMFLQILSAKAVAVAVVRQCYAWCMLKSNLRLSWLWMWILGFQIIFNSSNNKYRVSKIMLKLTVLRLNHTCLVRNLCQLSNWFYLTSAPATNQWYTLEENKNQQTRNQQNDCFEMVF